MNLLSFLDLLNSNSHLFGIELSLFLMEINSDDKDEIDNDGGIDDLLLKRVIEVGFDEMSDDLGMFYDGNYMFFVVDGQEEENIDEEIA